MEFLGSVFPDKKGHVLLTLFSPHSCPLPTPILPTLNAGVQSRASEAICYYEAINMKIKSNTVWVMQQKNERAQILGMAE